MKYFCVIFILIGILLGIWMFLVEPNLLSVKKIFLKDEQLDGLKIVFASDFHVKPYEKYRLKRIVKTINRQLPDIILLGGDYVNGHRKGFTLSADEIAKELHNLKSKYGTIAVMGNHDGWQGKDEVIKAFEENGITVLENANKKFKEFTIAGVEDFQTGRPNVKNTLVGVVSPVILLTHSPDVFPRVSPDVNLTLAGHTHGGQIVLPGGKILTVPSLYGTRYAYGLKEENGKRIFISKGLGTSILPLRFNCIPEIVVIEFIK